VRNLVYGLYVIVVSLVGVEVLSGAYFFHQNGNLIWFRTNSREEAKAAPAGQSDTRQKLFPYIGYGLRPGWKPSDNASLEQLQEATGISSKPEWWDWPANNLGFQAAHDIPYAPEDANTVIVGIFGGSVANGFGLMAADGVKKVVHGIPGYEIPAASMPFTAQVAVNCAKSGR